MVWKLTTEQFNREKNYYIALAIAKSMLLKRIIDDADYKEIDKMLIEKYNPVIGKLKI